MKIQVCIAKENTSLKLWYVEVRLRATGSKPIPIAFTSRKSATAFCKDQKKVWKGVKFTIRHLPVDLSAKEWQQDDQ